MDLGKIVSKIGYVYIILPICIFMCGWCKWYIWVPGLIIIGICFVQLMRKSQIEFRITMTKKTVIILIGVLLVCAAWVYLSGIGKLVFQNSDHYWRNRIFEMLVKYDWPIVKEYSGSNLVMCYYIAFWMPAALFGKAFGVAAGFIFQVVWAFLGVLVTYGLICTVLKKFNLWPLLVFVFFSGLDLVGRIIFSNLYDEPLTISSHIERWSGFEFSANTTQLFWVFNQAIFAWIIFLLIMLQKQNRFRIFIIAFAPLSSSLPFVGMLPFLLYRIFKTHISTGGGNTVIKWKALLKDTLSFENIVGGGFVGVLSVMYLSVNKAAGTSIIKGLSAGMVIAGIAGLFALVAAVYLPYKYRNRKWTFMILTATAGIAALAIVLFGSDEVCKKAIAPVMVLLLLLLVNKAVDWKKGDVKQGKMELIAAIVLFSVAAVILVVRILRASLRPGGMVFTNWNITLVVYLFGVLLDFMLYFACVFKYHRKNGLYYVALMWLLICPWIVVGTSNDFCMRASIPALLVVYLMVVDVLGRAFREKSKVLFALLLAVLIIGSFTATSAMVRAVTYTTPEKSEVSEKRVWKSKNFSGPVDDSFFGKYIIR